MLTQLQISQIKQGIRDCDRFIALESPRSADLRPANVAQHLEFCKTHKVKLQSVLATGDLSLLQNK